MNNKLKITVRIIPGIVLLVFGLNKLIPFLPPQNMADEVMQAFGALMALKFVLPTVAIIEVAVGLSLLTNRFTSLTLVLLMPISYSIVAFHLAFDPSGILPAAIVALLNIGLLVINRATYREVLAMAR